MFILSIMSSTPKKGRDADADQNVVQPAAKKRRVARSNGANPADNFTPLRVVKPEPIGGLDLDQLLNAPGDDQSVDIDDMIADLPRVEATLDANRVLVEQDDAMLMREYITHALLRGEALPLLKVKINDKVNSIKHNTELALLVVEIRYVSEMRGNLLPDWFHAGDRKQHKINATAENVFASRHPGAQLPERKERDVVWMRELVLQAAVQAMRTTTGCKLNNTQHGGIMTVDTNIYLTLATLERIKKDILTVLTRRFLIAKNPSERFGEEFSIRTLLGNAEQSGVVKMITSIVNELTVNTSQAIWAEMVSWLIHVKDIEPDLLSTAMRINSAFGMRYPAYVMTLYSLLLGSQDEMREWGFDGDFTSLTTLILSRAALMKYLMAWEETNMRDGHALKDYQRSAILDMVVQEYADQDFIDKVQGGARGKEHYADPGTGKTLMLLAATFFMDALPSANKKGKTLFIIPTSALNAFRTQVFEHMRHSSDIEMYGYVAGQFMLMNVDPSKKPYSTEDKVAFEKARYIFLTHDRFSELKMNNTIDSLLLKCPWTRVILDEAHVFIGRTSNRFRYLLHAISPKSPRYLLTGTAVSTAVSDIIGQVRLMGYKASKDEDSRVTGFVTDSKNAPKFAILDAAGVDQTRSEGMLYVQSADDEVAPFGRQRADKKLYPMEEKLLTEFKSRSILRMINRVAITSGSIDGKKKIESPFIQPDDAISDGPVRNLSVVYRHLDNLLTKIMEDEIRPVNQLLEEIKSMEDTLNQQLVNQITRNEARNGNDVNAVELANEARAFAVDKTAKSTHNPAFLKLATVLKTVYRLSATRNYGVDVRLLSAPHLRSLRTKIAALIRRTASGDYEDPADPDIPAVEIVVEYLEAVEPYKNTKKEVESFLKLFELTEADAIANGVREWINPTGEMELPLRYAEILNRLDTHLHSGQGKVIVFFADRSALLTFTAWFYLTTHQVGTRVPYYPLITKNSKDKEVDEVIGDWKERGPYWNFALLNYEKTADERERMVAWFTNPAHPVKVLFTTYEIAETGYNLQAANMVILAQQPYSDATRVQAVARAYRINQKEDVTVVDMWSANTGESVVRATRKYRQQVGTQLDALLAEAKLLQQADTADEYTKTTFREYSIPLGKIDPAAYVEVMVAATTPPEPKKVRERLPKQVAANPPTARTQQRQKKKKTTKPVGHTDIVLIDAMDIDEPQVPARDWLDAVLNADVTDNTALERLLLLGGDAGGKKKQRVLDVDSSEETIHISDSDGEEFLLPRTETPSPVVRIELGSDPMDVDEKNVHLPEKKRIDGQLERVEAAYKTLNKAWGLFLSKRKEEQASLQMQATLKTPMSELKTTLADLRDARDGADFSQWTHDAINDVQGTWSTYHDSINAKLTAMKASPIKSIQFLASDILDEFEYFNLYSE